MLKRRKKNTGMSLVEVLVSMLVLSIAVVTVMTAFSMATKVNVKTKEAQDYEALMENLVEYAEAGGTDFESWFVTGTSATYTPPADPSAQVREETITGIEQGFHKFNVKITTDTNPSKYSGTEMNQHKVVQFGGTSSNTILIDASLKSNDRYPVDGEADYDTAAYQHFYSIYLAAIEEHNAEVQQAKAEAEAAGETYEGEELLSADPLDEAFKKYIDRELWLTTSAEPGNKMRLQATMVYQAGGEIRFPSGLTASSERRYEMPIYFSGVYDVGSSTDEGAVKLDQIYIMYSEETVATTTSANLGKDIRILDASTEGNRRLKANVFIAIQEGTSMPVPTAAAKTNLENRVADKTLRLSSRHPVSGDEMMPIAVKLYCSAKTLYEGNPPEITREEHSLVTTGEEVRVVTVSFEITDPDTGAVLSQKEVTRLQ